MRFYFQQITASGTLGESSEESLSMQRTIRLTLKFIRSKKRGKQYLAPGQDLL